MLLCIICSSLVLKQESILKDHNGKLYFQMLLEVLFISDSIFLEFIQHVNIPSWYINMLNKYSLL